MRFLELFNEEGGVRGLQEKQHGYSIPTLSQQHYKNVTATNKDINRYKPLHINKKFLIYSFFLQEVTLTKADQVFQPL